MIKQSLKIFFLLLIFCYCDVVAQTKNFVTGIVKDSNGDPLIGVTVINTKTKNGTVTDFNGNFKLDVPAKAAIQFSYVGYTTVKRSVQPGDMLTVVMKEDDGLLDEVVVVGYNVVRKSDLTGSVASLKSENLENKTLTSLEDGFKGQIAGVTVATYDGTPGEKMDIRIRGANSINASNTPLYVVDGVLMDAADVDISTGEVATMDILKDASSTAIYGSRGANGVVVITTKRGTKGRAKVSFGANFTVQTPVRLYDMMDSDEYAKYRWLGWGALAYRPTGNANTNQIDLVDAEGVPYRLTLSGNQYTTLYENSLSGDLPNTDWQNAMLRNALLQEYRLNISGADDKTNYSIMGNIFDQKGIVIFSDYTKYNVRLNLDRKIFNNLRVGINASGSISYQNSPTGNVITNMLSQPPSKKEQAEEIETAPGEDETVNLNPVYQAEHIKNELKQEKLSFKTYVDYNFAKIFRLNVSGAYNINRSTRDRYYPSNVTGGKATNGKAQNIIQNNLSWQNENLLYILPKPWNIHKLDGLVGVTLSGWDNESLTSEVNNFEYEGLGSNNLSFGTVPVLSTNSITHMRMLSAIARANYTLKDRYLMTFSMRADGSSRFAPGNKWAYFPSGAFAWRLSEEPFIKRLNVFSNLKLRMSAGRSGNTGISAYQTLAVMNSSNYAMNGSDGSFGAVASRIPNKDLTWETTNQYDLGFDLGFFNNRLTAEVDLYYKQTRDLLLIENIPNYLGYKSRWTNKGKVDNRGLEITILGTPIAKKNFTWSSNFNISFNRSKVLYINEKGIMYLSNTAQSATDFNVVMEGKPLGLWYGYKVKGIYKSESELKTSGIKSIFEDSALRPGYLEYEDINGDKVINEADRQILGYAEPKFTGGFNNTFDYKDFSLYIGMEFRYGGTVFNATRMSMENGKGARNQTKRYAMYHYVPTLYYKDSGELYMLGNEDVAYLRTAANQKASGDYVCSSLYIEDGSYLRISDISLSYKLPKKYIQKIKMQEAKFFVSVRNPFLFTKYTGYDPDVNMAGSNKDLAPNLDNMAYPRTRSFTMGVNLSF